MNPFLHFQLNYLRRFSFEIALLWIVSFGLSVAVLRSAGEEITARVAPVELLLIAVVVIRFALAEVTFKTTGGWQVRPLNARLLSRARLAALLKVLFLPMLFRMFVWQDLVTPDGKRWLYMLWNDLLPLAAFALGLLVVVRLSRLLLARESAGLALVVVSPLLLVGAFSWISGAMKDRNRGYSVTGSPYFPASLLSAMPEQAYYLGKFAGDEYDSVTPAGRMPLVPGEYDLGDRTVVLREAKPDGDKLLLDLEFRSAQGTVSTVNLIFVVRYSDGSFSAGGESTGYVSKLRFGMFAMNSETRMATYDSPRSLPWNTRSWPDLLRGAELMVFARTHLAPMDVLARNSAESSGRSLPSQELAYYHAEGKRPPFVKQNAKMSRGADKIDAVLSWPTWSNVAWKQMVEPFLLLQADDSHCEGLERRFMSDSRLAGVLFQKNWHEKVIPELMRRLRAHEPLEEEDLIVLSGFSDDALADDLAAAFIRVDRRYRDVFPNVVNYPGNDSRKLALEGWQRVKATGSADEKKDQFATWAAAEGDVTAVRYLAGRPDRSMLYGIIESGGMSPIEWLAKNGDSMRFDPKKKMFVGGETR